MKKLKKLLVTLFACTFILSMAACSKGNAAKDALDASIKKQKKLTSTDMLGTMNMDIEMNGTKISMKSDFDAKVADINKDSIRMAMNMNMSAIGQKMTSKIYYTGGYYYMNINNQKTKMKMDLAALKESLKSSTGQGSLDASQYKSLKLKDDGDNKVLTYKLNDKGLNEYLKSAMSSMSSITGQASAATTDVKISGFSGQRTLNKDNDIIGEKIKFTITSKSSSVGKISMTMDTKYNNPGKDVVVTLPNDLNTYKETVAATTAATTAATATTTATN